MNKRYAMETIEAAEYWEDYSCRCFSGSAPCAKCLNTPEVEDIEEARAFLRKFEEEEL